MSGEGGQGHEGPQHCLLLTLSCAVRIYILQSCERMAPYPTFRMLSRTFGEEVHELPEGEGFFGGHVIHVLIKRWRQTVGLAVLNPGGEDLVVGGGQNRGIMYVRQ